ncbi:AAA family ATPase [Nocardia sp. CDC153]|uniref:AAA family ATPase n=1 Tax=Nocardia sp. CDC153 TaxID=3112167 RepID=UPI002DBFD9EE|nr:AAA family ATPase [Nocardia sp. CDC153]MEC3953403.1 AAA family ATPase [Nocardia sp. CDC153]
MSVLWITGAPGVGKSTVGWALYEWARERGRAVAYIDIDQLGLMLPAPDDDPRYHRVEAANLLEMIAVYSGYGARQIIVSGVVDPHRGIAPYVGGAHGIEFTLIRLRCEAEELRRRYLGRGSTPERHGELMALADTLDRSEVGSPLDTTTMTPNQVVRALSKRIPPGVQDLPSPASAPVEPSLGSRFPILLLAGPTAVGKSTVGWEILRVLRDRGTPAAFIDVDQFGFLESDLAPEVKADNLIRVWHGYRNAGAQAMIVVARGAPHRYQRRLAHEHLTTAYLEASPRMLADRIARRSRGEGPRLAGDSLLGASARQQHRIALRAAGEATALHRHSIGSVVIDTDHMTIADVAAKLAGLLLQPATLAM